MEAVFLRLFNMSVTAGWLVMAIVLLRLVFRKAPKALWCLLWGMVALRLICPISFESSLSLIPSAQPVPEALFLSEAPAVPAVPAGPAVPLPARSGEPGQIFILSRVWILGVAVMGGYALVSYLRLRRRLTEAVPLENRILSCDGIGTPFILGLIRPRIYLPSDLSPVDLPYVLAHEQAHLSRGDHLWKPLGFLLLSIYWFHPMLWAAYLLLCRDIEMACDEKVMKILGPGCKKAYSLALIRCSVSRRAIAACPLAFGGGEVKERVKTVLNYKKPSFWVILIALILVPVLAVCFLSDPRTGRPPDFSDLFSFQDLQTASVDTVVLTNLHNGEETEITEPGDVQEILDFLEYTEGRFPESGKGWSEGSYELSFRAGREILRVSFGDSPCFYTGEYGDGYPIRYHFYGHSIEEVIRFFSRFDSSGSTVLEDRIRDSAGTGVTLDIEVRSPGCILARLLSRSGLACEIQDFSLESQTETGWEEFLSDSGISRESAEDAADAATLFWMDDLPIGHHRVIVTADVIAEDGHRTKVTLPKEFDIIARTAVPGSVPLAYLPSPIRLDDPALDGCLVVGGTTVLCNQIIWDTFLEHVESGETAFPIRIALSDTGSEDSIASQVIDVVHQNGGFQVEEFVDGSTVTAFYPELRRVEFEAPGGGSGYEYILTGAAGPLAPPDQVLLRQMDPPRS